MLVVLPFCCGPEYCRAPAQYAHFPGTEDGNAWFEQNDAMWLGRVMKQHILNRSRWEFWCGQRTSGEACWSHEDTIAESVFR